MYNAAEQSNYRGAVNDFQNRLEKLKNSIVVTKSIVVLTGDVNFTEISCANMSSTKDYEELILDQFVEKSLSSVAPSQLAVFLCNTPEINLNCT